MSEASTAKSLFHKSRRSFLLRKLHSLTGALPVGGFLVFHLWTNAKALQGQDQYDHAVSDIGHMPYVPLLELGLIMLPLLFHAIYGVVLALEGRPNIGRYTSSRNWMYTLQRATGLLAFLFIGYHLWQYWGQKWLGRMSTDEFYPRLCASMASTLGGVPVVGTIYMLGILACVIHFANGLWGFCFSWGITVSRRAQQGAAVLFGAFGFAVLLLGLNTVVYFATGAPLPLTAGLSNAGPRGCVDAAPAPTAAALGAAHPEAPAAR